MAEEIECIAKQWGSSVGIIIPQEVVKRIQLKPLEKIRVTVEKVTRARDIWNLGPLMIAEPTQKIKDELRKGW